MDYEVLCILRSAVFCDQGDGILTKGAESGLHKPHAEQVRVTSLQVLNQHRGVGGLQGGY